MPLDTQKERLQWARKHHGRYKQPTEAARAFGWKISTYLGHENGDRPIGRQSAIKYARRYRVRWPWLLENDGPPTAEAQAIPIDSKVGAGVEFEPFDDNDPGLGEAPITVEPNSGALQVEGDSMYPRYFHGELLYYIKEKRSPKELLGKECVVRLTNGKVYVKIIKRGSTADLFDLESWNGPTLEDQEIDWVAPVTWRRG